MKNVRKIDEEILINIFKTVRGGDKIVGFKSPWWAKNIIPDEEELIKFDVIKFIPTPYEISLADFILFEVMLKLKPYDRKIIFTRCGKGKVLSYRKCGAIFGMHHEVFRQEFQRVISAINKIIDEINKKAL